MVNKYKLINEKNNHGFWLTTLDILDLIKICDNRNNYYKKKLIDVYEHLENKKFDSDLIKKKTDNKIK